MYLKRLLLLSHLLLLLISCRSDVNSKGDKNINVNKEVNEAKKIDNSLILKPSEDTSQYITLRTVDLGTIHAGEIVTGKLDFSTSSDSIVNIREFKGTCGCTDIMGVFKELKKGEVKSISYLIRTADKSGEEYFDIIIDSSIGKYIVEIKANVKTN